MAASTASNTFGVRVVRLRKGAGGAAAFFDVNVGYTNSKGEFVPVMTAKDFALKKSKAGDYFFNAPSKPRIKNGEHQEDANGYKIYDPLVDMYIEKGAGRDGGWGPTKASLALKAEIVKQATAALESLQTESTGRGPSAVDSYDNEDENDLPF